MFDRLRDSLHIAAWVALTALASPSAVAQCGLGGDCGSVGSAGGCADTDIDRQVSAGRVLVWGAEVLGRRRFALPHHLALTGELSYTWTGSSFRSGFTSDFPQLAAVAINDRLPCSKRI